MRACKAFNISGLTYIVASLTVATLQTLPASADSQVIRGRRPLDPPPATSNSDTFKPRELRTTFNSPTDLSATLDVQECTLHGGFGGGLACKTLLPQGRLALVWKWAGPGQADGFRVYRLERRSGISELGAAGSSGTADVQNWGRSLVATLTTGRGNTLYIADASPTANYAGDCYGVTAYNAVQEFEVSNPFCVGARNNVKKISLQVLRLFSQNSIAMDNLAPVDEKTSTTILTVGYWLNRNSGYEYSVSGGELMFQLPDLSHSVIDLAHLLLRVDTASVYADGRVDQNSATSCLSHFGIATNEWWGTDTHWNARADVLALSTQMGPHVSYDVTSIVKTWAAGAENDGFTLFGDYGFNPPPPNDEGCFTTYRPEETRLEILYH